VTCPRHVPQVVELSKAVYLVLDEAGRMLMGASLIID